MQTGSREQLAAQAERSAVGSSQQPCRPEGGEQMVLVMQAGMVVTSQPCSREGGQAASSQTCRRAAGNSQPCKRAPPAYNNQGPAMQAGRWTAGGISHAMHSPSAAGGEVDTKVDCRRQSGQQLTPRHAIVEVDSSQRSAMQAGTGRGSREPCRLVLRLLSSAPTAPC